MKKLTIAITMPEDGFVAYAMKNGWEAYEADLEEPIEDGLTAMTQFAIQKLGENILQDYMIQKHEEARAAAMNIVNQAGLELGNAGLELVGIEDV